MIYSFWESDFYLQQLLNTRILFSLYRFLLQELHVFSHGALQLSVHNGGVRSRELPNEIRVAAYTLVSLSLVIIFARNDFTDSDKMASVYCENASCSPTPRRIHNTHTRINK
jgi:hypothetical protein